MPQRREAPQFTTVQNGGMSDWDPGHGWRAPAGRVVLLNGTSSSGKSSIATELLRVLPGPWFHLSADAVNGMRGRARSLELESDALDAALARTRAGFHRVVAGMARAGNDVVADCVLSERWRLLDCLDVLADCDVLFVGVRCDPVELDRRERARGDRLPGSAAAQAPLVHAHGDYDLECDTTATSPADCAAQITAFLTTRPRPTAFDRLSAELRRSAPLRRGAV
jgi:chloramphenicol 3-O phosphotransferase